jgi:hypothetical protein
MGLKSTTVCLGYKQVTSLSAAAGLPDIPKEATLALIVPETQGVRWRDDGTDPTASVGMPVAAGSYLSYDGDLRRIKFIQQSASAKINISYYA